jgi:hypothetical protein
LSDPDLTKGPITVTLKSQTTCTKRKETTRRNEESIEHLPLILIE